MTEAERALLLWLAKGLQEGNARALEDADKPTVYGGWGRYYTPAQVFPRSWAEAREGQAELTKLIQDVEGDLEET